MTSSLRIRIAAAFFISVTTQAPTASAQTPSAQIQPQNIAATNDAKPISIETKWDTVLKAYVKAPDALGLARFNYAELKASAEDQQILSDYIDELESQNPESLPAPEAVVYWANLYNAVTVKTIIEHYPISSIRKIKSGRSSGPWKQKLITINGEDLSLDNVEHDILRKKYPSPLIHYMVNCASIGCPNLKNGVWRADTLKADQEAAARAYINSPRGVNITAKGLKVSSIYKWFKKDFGGSKDTTLAHIRNFAEGDLLQAIEDGTKITGYDYDWDLNE